MNRSTVRVNGIATELPDDGKQCRLHGITITATCPKCGMEHTRDLGQHYLSCGSLNLSWNCDREREVDGQWITEGCGHSWRTPLRCEIRLIPLCNVAHPTDDGVVCAEDQQHSGLHGSKDQKEAWYIPRPGLSPADYSAWCRDQLYERESIVSHNGFVWVAIVPNKNREPGGTDWGVWSKQ